jgi:hypothetical protein
MTVDTLKLSRRLREQAHLDQEQAEGFAEALADAFQEQIATKIDLELLEQRLTIKMGAIAAVAIGILLTLEKLIK